MSTDKTIRMLRVYEQMAAPTRFLSGFFDSPPQNFHTTEQVEFDIIRSEEDIAIVIQDLSTGYRQNEANIYTNKNFTPPIYKEAVTLNAFKMINRRPGATPFEDPIFRTNATMELMQGMTKIEAKIRRSQELQASQVLQTGQMDLVDANGTSLYTVDFKPKATHFPTVSVSWSSGSADISGDIISLADVIRADGLSNPDQLIMSQTSFENMLADPTILARLDNRRIEANEIATRPVNGEGATFQGVIAFGHYRYDIWTYSGRYKDPQTGNSVPFIEDDKVIIRSSGARMDATFGAIPNFANDLGARRRLLPELPTRLSLAGRGADLFTNVWMTPDGEQLMGGVGTRSMMIPTAIDTYGCLTTEAP